MDDVIIATPTEYELLKKSGIIDMSKVIINKPIDVNWKDIKK